MLKYNVKSYIKNKKKLKYKKIMPRGRPFIQKHQNNMNRQRTSGSQTCG